MIPGDGLPAPGPGQAPGPYAGDEPELESLARRLDAAAVAAFAPAAGDEARLALHAARSALAAALRHRGGPWRRGFTVYSVGASGLMSWSEHPGHDPAPRSRAHRRPRSLLGSKARHIAGSRRHPVPGEEETPCP